MTGKPNIVFILVDQQRADMLGSYGDPVARTPNTDRLAREGVQFDHCIAQAPLCMPSRSSMLCERYVRDHGVFQNYATVHPTVPTFLNSLCEAGYHTALNGKCHFYPYSNWDGRHMNTHRGTLRAYGFAETDEIAGKEGSFHIDSAYTDYLARHGLLQEFRDYVKSRSKSLGYSLPGVRMLEAWRADPLPLPVHGHIDAWLGGHAADWIRNHDGDAPFFLQVGFGGPHDPWDAPTEALEAFGHPEIPMPGSIKPPEIPRSGPLEVFLRLMTEYSDTATMTPDAIAAMRRAYYANMMIIDDSIGRIIAALEERGQLDNTWIVYASDHGEMMGEHRLVKKMVFYEPSVQVPLIIRPPGGLAGGMAGRRVDDLVELNDISATFRDIAGAPMPTSQARSLLPALSGQSVAREVAISEAYGVAMFRTATHKLVVYEDTVEPMQFFDLEADPHEDRNLVGTGADGGMIERMMDAYARPFLSVRPVRPTRGTIERGRISVNDFYLPGTVFPH